MSVSENQTTLINVTNLQNFMEQASRELRGGCLKSSQYKIEACLIRVADKLNYVLLSSNTLLTSRQKPQEFKPYNLEPPKQIYFDPVVVLDFQSFYPSIMISHNICYSTLVGHKESKVRGQRVEMGFTYQEIPWKNIDIKDLICTFNGSFFVKKSIKEGIIPQILREFYQTRIMLKSGKKIFKLKSNLNKIESQQQILKLFMNVMYGYTSAGFSGKMPCRHIGDAVVSTAKTILYQTMQKVERMNENYQVIYGDTDSLFVVMKGFKVQDALIQGQKIAKLITSYLPSPIELQFEKVYHPFFVNSKKKYCGIKFENLKKSGKFEVKGLEMIRSDSCKFVEKYFTQLVQQVFENQSLKSIISFFQQLSQKHQMQNFPLEDFIFERKFRQKKYSVMTPALVVAQNMQDQDYMKTPVHKERIKYVVVTSPSQRLYERIVELGHFLQKSEELEIDQEYYFLKALKSPLKRFFFCLGISEQSLNLLFNQFRFKRLKNKQIFSGSSLAQGMNRGVLDKSNYNSTIEQFLMGQCVFCGKMKVAEGEICGGCLEDIKDLYFEYQIKKKLIKKEQKLRIKPCLTCSPQLKLFCQNTDCQVFHQRLLLSSKEQKISSKFEIIQKILKNQLNLQMSNEMYEFKRSADPVSIFSDSFNFKMKIEKEEVRLVNEVDPVLVLENFDEGYRGINDVEIDNEILKFLNQNPEFQTDIKEEYDYDSIHQDLQQDFLQVLVESSTSEMKCYDFENGNSFAVSDGKNQKISIDKVDQQKLNLDNFEQLMISLELNKGEEVLMQEMRDQLNKGLKIDYQVHNEKLGKQKSLQEIDKFLKSIKMAKEYPFELDEFQKRAVYFIEKEQNVFVAAHTSAGKTVVAEYAIAKALKNKSKVIFTSPIKALSNQKYYEFSKKFNKNVGIITGDVQLKLDANCLIMTTEILRNKLFRRCDSLDNLEWVIFDEVHYINDLERGSVWEETIILLPKSVGIVMLSATVENVAEFANWVTRTTEKQMNVLRTYKRPVPLKHHIYYEKPYVIKEPNQNFDEQAYKDILSKIQLERKKKRIQKVQKRKELMEKKRDLMNKSNQRERVRKMTRKKTNKNKFYFNKQLDKMPMRGDKNTTKLVNMIRKLKEQEKLPAIVFVFSKKTINTLADKAAENLSLVTSEEKKKILAFFERSVRRLKAHDKQILQIMSLKNMLVKGVGVHHGDMLWICKEIVELLFQQNLLKLLFATESFAMGINVPTKSVSFFSIRKNDGCQFRYLKSGEYTQMCGRAGRRGIDSEGNVFIFFGSSEDVPSLSAIKPMLLNKGEVLESKFKLTYSTIINSYTMNNFKVKDLMKKSFTENQSYLKIVNLKTANDLLVKNQQQNTIECPFSDQPIINLKEEKFIVLHDQLIQQLQENNKNFLNDFGMAKLAKLPLSPSLILALDKNYYFHLLVLYNVQVSQKSILMECLNVKTSTDETAINFHQNPLKKPKFKIQDEVQYKYSYYLLHFDQIVQFIDITEEEKLLIAQKKTSFAVLNKYRKLIKNQKILEMNLIENEQFKKLQLTQQTILQRLTSNKCFDCKSLQSHYSILNKSKKLDLEIESNDKKIKKLEITFGTDKFESLMIILKKLEFMDENRLPNVNMKYAKSLSSGPEVLLITLLYTNSLLVDLESHEIPVLLSVLCMNTNKQPDYDHLDQIFNENSFSERLIESIDSLNSFYTKIKNYEQEFKVNFDDYISFDMILPIYHWCNGCQFRTLYMFTDRMEGYIVRTINKIEKFIDSLRYLYIQHKKEDMVVKLEQATKLLRRDILNVQSLYLC